MSNHRRLNCLLNRCSGADQRKHQSPASMAFVRGIHRWPVGSPHKGPVTWKMFSFDDVIMDRGCFGKPKWQRGHWCLVAHIYVINGWCTPVRRQAFTWWNADLMSKKTYGKKTLNIPWPLSRYFHAKRCSRKYRVAHRNGYVQFETVMLHILRSAKKITVSSVGSASQLFTRKPNFLQLFKCHCHLWI